MSTMPIISATSILTNESMVDALISGGIPRDVATNVELVYDVAEIRKPVESGDIEELKSLIHNVGDKRAAKIISILKGRIPAPMSKPCPDVKRPDVEMHDVPNFNLVYRDGRAMLTKDKVDMSGEVIRDKAGKIVKDIPHKRFGPALQYLQKVADQKENVVFTTTTPVQEDKNDPAKSYMMERFWKFVCLNGIKIGENRKAMPLIMGTNAKMKCQIHWADEAYIERTMQWVRCGAKLETAQNIAKIEAYYGLLLPYTHPLLCGVLNPHMEAITPSWEKEHEGANVLIDPDGTMTRQDKFIVNEFDGMCFIELTEKLIRKLHLGRHELRQLRRAIAKFNGGTIRGPWHKGVIVVGFHIHEYLHNIGVHTINGKDIDDIAIFGDKTIFKAAVGEGGLYEKFEDFADAFVSMQHRFGVLLENHGIKKTFLPAQQLQAAHGAANEHIETGAHEEVAYLNLAKEPKVAADRYVPRVVARIAQKDPSIMSTWFATELANNGYKKEYDAALSGRTHGNSVSGFGIKDPVAYCEWVAYTEGVRKELPTGILGAYEIYAPTAGFTGRAVASRNPVIANYGLHTVNVIDELPGVDEFFDEGFDYIVCGIHDDLCKLLRMDHDGDKIRLTNAEWFCDAVESVGSDGIFAEWESFGAVAKVVPTRENELAFFGTCTATPTLGLNVDTCGKMISNGVVTTDTHEMIMDYLMNKGTDVKQGADGSKVTGDAGIVWNEMQKANKESRYSIAQAYGKGLKKRDVPADKIASEYGDSNLDIISKAVHNNATQSLSFSGSFETAKVLKVGMVTVKGLVGSGTKEKNYEDAGLFNKLVARNAREWDDLDEEEIAKNSWAEYQAWKKQEALKEVCEFVQADDKYLESIDKAYDAITTYVFETLRKSWNGQNTSENKRKWLVVLARTYIEWFGDKLEEVFCANENIDVLPAVSEGVDVGEVFGE